MGIFKDWITHRERMEAMRCVSQERCEELRGTSALAVANVRAEADVAIAKVAHPEPVLHPKSTEIQLPDDLEAHVMQWGDEWARDDERGNLRRLYLEQHTGDAEQTWQKVRRSVGIGEMPT